MRCSPGLIAGLGLVAVGCAGGRADPPEPVVGRFEYQAEVAAGIQGNPADIRGIITFVGDTVELEPFRGICRPVAVPRQEAFGVTCDGVTLWLDRRWPLLRSTYTSTSPAATQAMPACLATRTDANGRTLCARPSSQSARVAGATVTGRLRLTRLSAPTPEGPTESRFNISHADGVTVLGSRMDFVIPHPV